MEHLHTAHHQPMPLEDQVLKPVEKDKDLDKKKLRFIILAVFIILIFAGIGTGFILSGKSGSTSATGALNLSIGGGGEKTFGSTDTKTFSDTTIGTVQKDGTSGEGTHTLVRDGGPSQTACLVSSTLDLDQFVGKKVKVWSKTMAAKKCAWLMDVGRVELQ